VDADVSSLFFEFLPAKAGVKGMGGRRPNATNDKNQTKKKSKGKAKERRHPPSKVCYQF
jgi:hypothetical protein